MPGEWEAIAATVAALGLAIIGVRSGAWEAAFLGVSVVLLLYRLQRGWSDAVDDLRRTPPAFPDEDMHVLEADR